MVNPDTTTDLARQWGQAVAARRHELGTTQTDLAHSAGVKQQTISAIEKGLILPVDATKMAVAAALDINPGVLFAWPT